MFNIILFPFLVSCAFVAGSFIVLFLNESNKLSLDKFLALTSGVLLGTAFLHIIPEGTTLNPNLFSYGLFFSFCFLFLFERFTILHSCTENPADCDIHPFGTIAFFTLFLHNSLDGVAISSSFVGSVKLGLLTFLSIFLHNLPLGMSTIAIFLANKKTKNTSLLNTLIISLATPLGAFIAYLFLVNQGHSLLAAMLGVSAGSLLYLGATDILPTVHTERDGLALAFFLIGILVMLGSKVLGS